MFLHNLRHFLKNVSLFFFLDWTFHLFPLNKLYSMHFSTGQAKVSLSLYICICLHMYLTFFSSTTPTLFDICKIICETISEIICEILPTENIGNPYGSYSIIDRISESMTRNFFLSMSQNVR